jgi:hypothetical protein
MLKMVSWGEFVEVMLVGTGVYYSVVVVKYYGADFVRWMRKRPTPTQTPKPEEKSEDEREEQ